MQVRSLPRRYQGSPGSMANHGGVEAQEGTSEDMRALSVLQKAAPHFIENSP